MILTINEKKNTNLCLFVIRAMIILMATISNYSMRKIIQMNLT